MARITEQIGVTRFLPTWIKRIKRIDRLGGAGAVTLWHAREHKVPVRLDWQKTGLFLTK